MSFRPGDASFEVRWIEGGRFRAAEYTRDEAALEKVGVLLRSGAAGVATVVKWRHHANLPGCSPAVVARSVSMDVYRRQPWGDIARQAIDIHGGGY